MEGLNRYTVEISTVPFPFVITVRAFSEKSAIGKAKYQAKRHGLKAGRLLSIQLTN